MKCIRCVGGAAIDYKLQAQQSFIPHTSNPVIGFHTLGGVARNVAENLAQWYTNVALQTVVGADQQGKQIIEHMQRLGINTKGTLILESQRTAHYFAAVDKVGELSIAFADMQIFDHTPLSFSSPWSEWQAQDIIFLETNLPATIIERALQFAAHKNFQICIDPVSVAKSQRLPQHLAEVFIIKPNVMELTALTNHAISNDKDVVEASYRLLDRGVNHIVTTLGDQGYIWVNQSGHHKQAALPCENIKDVNGCGDAFVAGLLYGLAEDATLIEACELGQQAAVKTLQTQHSISVNRQTAIS